MEFNFTELALAAIASGLAGTLISHWLNRRNLAADIKKKEAETRETEADTRHAADAATHKKTQDRLELLEKLGAADTGGLREALAALERSRAEAEALKEKVAAQERARAAEVGALTSQVETMTKGMDGLTVQVKDLTEQVTDLKGLMEGANQTIQAQGETIKEQSEELVGVRQELTVANENNLGLKQEVADLKRILTETTAALNSRISDLINQIKGMGAVPVAAAESETAVTE